jgi:hypothetical protein
MVCLLGLNFTLLNMIIIMQDKLGSSGVSILPLVICKFNRILNNWIYLVIIDKA